MDRQEEPSEPSKRQRKPVPRPDPDPDILGVDDIMRLFDIPATTVRYLAKNGRIPAKKVGRAWRFRRSEVEEWWETRD